MRNFTRKLNICLLLSLLLVALVTPMGAAAADYSCTASIPVRVQVYAETDAEFTVQLEAEEGVPLPEVCSLTVTGSGEVSFGPVAYTVPGDYVYTITQVQGNAKYVTYDDTVYTVTVRVTNDGKGGLVSEIWAVEGQNTQKTEEVRFVNRYTPPTQPPVTQSPGTPPQTGDAAHVAPLMAVFAVAAVALLGLAVGVKRRTHQR